MNRVVTAGLLAGVVFGAASWAAAQEKSGGGPLPEGVKNLGSGLQPLQLELAGKAEAVARTTDEAKEAARQTAAAEQELARVRRELAAAKVPPPPGAAPAVAAERQARVAQLTTAAERAQADLSQKTLAATRVEQDRRTAVAALEDFRRTNPAVTLPPTHAAAAKLRGLNLPDLGTAFRQADDARLSPDQVFDGRGTASAPAVRLDPNQPNEPIPPRAAPRPAPQPDPATERERRELAAEAKAIEAEVQRLAGRRADLERRKADIQGRIEAHNKRRGQVDQTNELAVRSYNDECARLNREKADWEAEARGWDSERVGLLGRADRCAARAAALARR